jgi:hypothetical protein
MKKKVILIATAIILVCAGIIGWYSRFNFVPQLAASHLSSSHEKYPEITLDNLSSIQKSIVTVTKTEFQNQPDYKKYSEGNSEPWCSDFVSWVYKEAGAPLENPVSGSWRIPGTYTLRDYLTEMGRFIDPQSDYSPKTGDLMLYDNPNPFGSHVNIVLKVNSDKSVTTVGGNEPGGIRVKTHKAYADPGFVGYGILE